MAKAKECPRWHYNGPGHAALKAWKRKYRKLIGVLLGAESELKGPSGEMELRIRLLDERAKLPRRAHPNDAGLDLAPVIGAKDDSVIQPGTTMTFRTGVAVEIKTGHFGMLVPRSSAKLRGLDIVGIIDSDYRGEVKLTVTNIGSDAVNIGDGGEFLAQLIIVPVATPYITIVNELSPTPRGAGGFGSSGI